MYNNIKDKREYKYEIKRTAILDWNTFALKHLEIISII